MMCSFILLTIRGEILLYFSFVYLWILIFIGPKYKDRTRFFLVLFPFLLIIFLRYGIGADYFAYQRIYEAIDPWNLFKSFEDLPKVEPMYITINAIAIFFKLPYHLFTGLFASGLTLLILKWLQDNSPRFELSALLYYSILFIYWNISALRQGLVVTVLLFVYFNKKHQFTLWQRILSVIILFFIHPTAIIVPVIYVVATFRWEKVEFYVLLVLAPVLRTVVKVLINIIPHSVPYLGKLFKYLDYDSIQLISFPSLMRFAFIVFIVHHYIRLVEKYPYYRTMFNFSLLSLIMYFYLPTAMVVGTRTTIFGYYLVIIIFPMILDLYKSKEIYTLVLYGLMGLSLVSFYNELDKLVDRAGYKYDMHRLNTETIIQENRDHFDK